MAIKVCLKNTIEDIKTQLESHQDIEIINEETDWVLFQEDGILQLTHASEDKRKPLSIDFNSDQATAKANSIHRSSQPLLKALGKGTPNERTVWDLTAGLAQDSWLLISAGYQVTMVEQNPLIHQLLQDAVKNFEPGENTIKPNLFLADSAEFLKNTDDSPDVIYLDPMFPEKKKGRLSQGPMQWMQLLLKDTVPGDPNQLLSLSLEKAKERVVVKRGMKDPELGGPLIHSYKGSSVRYDMYQRR